MRIHVTRFVFGLALVFIAALAVQPAWAVLPTPNQPILVVQNSSSADPYQNFIPELLTTEGLNGFQTAQLGDLTAAFLANYDVVILPHLSLTAAQATLFQNYVNAGGTLVGFRPDLQLASVFGVASLGTTLQEAWLKMDITTPYAPSPDSEVMKFHGTADLYSLNGASALATLYNTTSISTTSPAAAINNFGLGKAILFSFDLTQSIVLMRQGNPAWAGYPNNHDGFNTMRASQMFMDQGSGQFWNDLGDGALNDVPQADIQLRLFSNIVTLTNASKRPLPKLWYYPNQNRAQLLMTGDDHSFPVSNALSEISNIGSFGGLFTYNLWYPFTTVSASQVNTWLSAGYSMGVHFNDTAEVDSSGVGGSNATWNGMQSVMSTALTSFAGTYTSAPFPVTTRNHFLIWVSNDANGTADQVAQAKLFQNNGIQFDTSYSSFPNRYGYMTGSGLPMKFLDPVAGSVIPVYEQATQYEDDVQLNSGGYSLGWNSTTAQNHYVQSLSDSLNKYNTVVTMLFHPENWGGFQSYADAALQYAQTQSIPMSTTGNWLTFWQARAATTISKPSFTSNVLTFTATGSPAGLTLLVPFTSGNSGAVSTFKVDNVAQSFTVATYQGVTDASVVLTAGTHTISVTYGSAGRISGQITPSPSTAATVQVQGGSITESVPVAADGTYVVGPVPAGTYTVTPVSSTYTFTPTSRSVVMSTADVTSVNFTANYSFAGETIFTTQTPVSTNRTDGTGVNYELGTAFTSGISGQINGIRFWRAPSESGTHVGKIWSITGTLLASVTFTNETSSGWQQQHLSAPLAIAANTTYIVSVNTANAFYAATAGGLSSQVVNGDLKTVVGNNGVFGTPGLFPNTNSNGANYFRDIFFSATPTSIAATAGTPQSAAVNTVFATPLQATVRDASNNPVPGVSVTFAAPGSGASGTFAGPTTVTTDNNGVATAPTLTANSTVGSYTVTASVAGVGTAASFTLTNTVSTSAALAIDATVSGDAAAPNTTIATSPFSTKSGNELLLAFISTDQASVPNTTVTSIAGAGLTWTFVSRTNVQGGDAEIWRAFAPSPLSSVTVTATLSQNVESSITVVSFTGVDTTGTNGSGAIGATGSGNANPGAPTASLVTTRNNSWVFGVGSDFDNPMSRTLGAGQTLIHQFLASVGDTYWVQSLTSPTAASGTTVTVNDTAPNGDQYNLSIVEVLPATSGGGSGPASITATAGTPQTATIGTAFTTALQATVKDASNNPVSGVTVTFTTPAQTGASGTFAGGVNTAITNASGVATSAVFTANSIAGGPYNVAASVSGVVTAANFALTNKAGAAAAITATAGTPQSATISTAFANTLQATVKDASNNLVVGVTVTFTAPAQTGASGTFAGGVNTAVTNASGVATSGVFTANSIAGGPYNVAASVSGVVTAANFALTNKAGSAATITATAGTPQSATIGTAFTATLQATVKDASNNPVSGVTVTFTAPAQTGASGTFAGGVNTAVTNASGVATSAVFTANSIAGGPYNVAASVSGVVTAANFALTNRAGSAAIITATSGTPQSAPFSTAFASALQATVKDASNNPVSGVTVTFTAPAQTGASGTFAGGVNTAVTNASGVVTSGVFTANGIAGGPYNVAALVSGVATAANFSLTNTSGTPASVTATGGTPQSATIGTAFTTALQATVKDASNNPVSGVTVTFTAPAQTGASGTFAGGVNTAVTNASGVATSAVFTANSIAGGPYNVAASVSGVVTAANFALTNTAGSAAAITATAGTPQSATIGTAFTNSLQATVKDSGNNPVSGVTVTFTAPAQTGASGTFAGGVNTAVTNASGVATSGAFTANSIAGGPYNVAASVSGVVTAANFALTNKAGSAATITATAGTPQSATVSSAFTAALQATVKDASNNPVSGVTVTFTAPAQTGASGTFAGGVNTAVTNASGAATSAVFTANSIAGGPYNVAASVSGVATAANFALTNTASTGIAIDVNKSTDRGTSATTIASPSFATAGANELLLAFISSDTTGGTNVSVSSIAGGGLTWALVQRTNTQAGTAEIWRAFAPAALSGVTVTATLSQSVAASITVMSFTGVNTTGTNGSGAIGAVGTGNANPGAPTASLLTTKANSIVVGVGNDWDNAISRTVGANQTMIHQYLAPIGDTYWVQRVTTLAPAGTLVTVNDTVPTSDRYNLAICEVVGP